MEFKCCANCKHCLVDPSTDTVECCCDASGEWVHQEEEDVLTPDRDYCTLWELDDDLYIDFEGLMEVRS